MSLRQQHVSQDLRELLLRLPWWAGLLCAATSYLILHPLAILQTPTPDGMLDSAATAVGQLMVGLAAVAQYLLPLGFLALASVSAFLSWKREDLRSTLASHPGGSDLRGLSRDDMALLLTAAYRAQGFRVGETDDALHRRGFDLELSREGERRLLQFRHWKSSQLDVGPLRDLSAALKRTPADGALVLISGRFSREATSFVTDKPIELLDGRRVKELILERHPNVLTALGDAVRRVYGSWDTPHERETNVEVSPDASKIRNPPPPIGGIRDHQPSSGSGESHRQDAGETGDTEHAERILGQALGALIRGESSVAPQASHSPPSPQVAPAAPPRGGVSTTAARIWIRPPIRIGRISNAVGVAIALVLIWGAYEWFGQLPAAPTSTPWDLLGQNRIGQDTGASQSDGVRGPIPAGDDGRPLGQYNFGPEIRLGSAAEPGQQLQIIEEEPIEEYKSIQELEDAFNARYIPSPSCYSWGSTDGMASCGNDRIRARRAFLASNGRTMVPTEPPPAQPTRSPTETDWAREYGDRTIIYEPRGEWRQAPQQLPADTVLDPRLDWRTPQAPGNDQGLDQEWYGQQDAQPYEDWRQESELQVWQQPDPYQPEKYQERQPSLEPPAYQERRYDEDPQAQPDRYREQRPRQDWTLPQDEYISPRWDRDDWQPRMEPLPQGNGAPAPARPPYTSPPPRIQRQAVEAWQTRDRDYTRDWGYERRPGADWNGQGSGDWRQESGPSGDWRRPAGQGAAEEPIPDWRQDWLQQR